MPAIETVEMVHKTKGRALVNNLPDDIAYMRQRGYRFPNEEPEVKPKRKAPKTEVASEE